MPRQRPCSGVFGSVLFRSGPFLVSQLGRALIRLYSRCTILTLSEGTQFEYHRDWDR